MLQPSLVYLFDNHSRRVTIIAVRRGGPPRADLRRHPLNLIRITAPALSCESKSGGE